MQMDKNMNLNEIMDSTNPQNPQPVRSDDYSDEETTIVGNDWMNDKPLDIVNDSGIVYKDNSDNVVNKEEYTGPGMVINNDEFDQPKEDRNVYTGITPEIQSHIDEYMNEMDDMIEEIKESADNNVDGDDDDVDESEEDTDDGNGRYTKDEFERKYDEAKIIIDKTGVGSVINFTDEEREKLERSKKIKLEEIETVSLETIKTKKLKKNKTFDKVIKKVTTACSANIVLPASGYTAVMRGCSAHELISLITGNNTALIELQTKWSLIYDKIESTSLGKMTYNEFLINTAAIDMNSFIYGILCATYPDDDTIPLTCQKCKTDFKHGYSIRSLIRAEKMSDRLKELMMSAVDGSVREDLAKAAHDAAPISQVERIKLPVSGIITELHVQSAHDFINKTAKELSAENREEKYENATIMSTAVNKFFIPDLEENDGSYFEIDEPMDIVKTIYSLGDVDNDILTKKANDILDGISFEFGLMSITCPKCNHFTATIPMDIENVLFYKYQQNRTTAVE